MIDCLTSIDVEELKDTLQIESDASLHNDDLNCYQHLFVPAGNINMS